MNLFAKVIACTTLCVAGNVFAADAPDARLAALEERMAIEKLMTGDYPRALDLRRWADYAALFTSDADLSFASATLHGAAAIQKYFETPRPSPGNRPPPKPGEMRTLHIVSNLSFNVKGDTATGGAYWQTIGTTDGRAAVLAAGHYDDVLKKVNGQWKFAKRAIVTDTAPPPGAAVPVEPKSN
ncbi:MAG: nuclear transport factor 2 family protein [Pseudomonadota bacterium]